MARYTEAVCRLCRREGKKLNLKGTRCNSAKCALSKKSYPPGATGSGMRRGKTSTYGLQLRAKQEAKRSYGVLERQFRRYFQMADKMQGVTGTLLIQILEKRLDNIVYRLGFAASRAEARQLVTHGNILVNSRKVNRPSYQVRPGEVVTVKPKMLEHPSVQAALDYANTLGRLTWLEWNPDLKQGQMIRVPDRDQIPMDLSEQMIVELYSK